MVPTAMTGKVEQFQRGRWHPQGGNTQSVLVVLDPPVQWERCGVMWGNRLCFGSTSGEVRLVGYMRWGCSCSDGSSFSQSPREYLSSHDSGPHPCTCSGNTSWATAPVLF